MAGWQRPVCRGLLSYPLVRASPSCSGSRTVGWSSWALANKPSPELTDLSPIPSPSPNPGRLSRRGARLDLRPQLDHGLPVRVDLPAPLVGSRHRVQGRERNPNPHPNPVPSPIPRAQTLALTLTLALALDLALTHTTTLTRRQCGQVRRNLHARRGGLARRVPRAHLCRRSVHRPEADRHPTLNLTPTRALPPGVSKRDYLG